MSDFAPDPDATGLAYSNIVIGQGLTPPGFKSGNPPKRTRDTSQAEAAQAESYADMSAATQSALEMSYEGDDTVLLPYQPTPSINPPRPRTLAAGYDRETRTLRIRFREGAGYEYYDVSPQEWQNFRRVKSPGRYINRVLNFKDYQRADF